MADIVVAEGSPVDGVQRYVRYVDNGDGTWSLKVSSTGGGGGGGAVTVANGADVAQGTTTDAAVTNPASAATEISILKGVLTLLAQESGQLPATLGPKDAAAALAVVGRGYLSDITVTRPANATPYTAGDVIGGVIEFTTIGPAGDHVLITSSDLAYNVANLPAGMGSLRAHIYSATPPSALADNAPWDLPSGDRASYLGYMDLGTIADVGSTLYVQADQIKQYKLAAASTSLWGYVVTNGGFTPAGSSEVLKLRLRAVGL